jgi:hypothetical protein
MVGTWRKGPGKALFDSVAARLGDAAPRIMAEDLGVITEDVKELRRSIGAPGMVVLQFAWGGGADNTHLPHNHYANSFVYPGTHDNETTIGWYTNSATVCPLCGSIRCPVFSGFRSLTWRVANASAEDSLVWVRPYAVPLVRQLYQWTGALPQLCSYMSVTFFKLFQ